ncbi:MAG: IgGFc-binding protein [Labilithrix sp.]|nr:IgGFc-binding protein [Labilithrix sp.]
MASIVLACGSARQGFDDGRDGPNGAGPGGSGGLGGLGGESACVDGRICVGFDIHRCDADGGAVGEKIGECVGADEACLDGECQSGCKAVDEGSPSNVGCEFWAVDLDQTVDPGNNAQAAPWGVVVANPGGSLADVTIEQNDAPPGEPRQLTVVKKLAIPGGNVETVVMPTREVDGSLQAANEGPGTVITSNAFRITSTAPIVVYQLNALAQAFSNDGSLLIPRGGLGLVHRVLAYPTAYPAPVPLAGVRRAYITVVGVHEATSVTIRTSTPTLEAPGFPALAKDGEVTVTLGPFDVFNLESHGNPGDFTGSTVVASKPVAVFTGTEMSAAPVNQSGVPTPPGGEHGTCCLDHLEEQLFPVESYGKRFVIPHSAVRSTGGWIEPDIIRFMGVATSATVTTNLPAPFDSFTLEPGEMRETYAQKDFIVESTEPIAIAQILVAQEWLQGSLKGDPSLSIFPAIDQYRRNYLFSVPKSWRENFVVVAMPVGAEVTIDGSPLPASCARRAAGVIGGVEFETRTCALSEGPHAMAGDKAFGITAYGYGTAGSYAFVGGANITKIYAPPPFTK